MAPTTLQPPMAPRPVTKRDTAIQKQAFGVPMRSGQDELNHINTHTVFGLDPAQLHARYWASFGVQVVRVGEPSEVVKHAELYLLCDPRSLPLFRLAPLMDTLNWVEPTVLTIRLRDQREQGYRERIIADNEDRFIRYERVYDERSELISRVALTHDREIAQLWQQAGEPLQGWRRIRRFIPRTERAVANLDAVVYDRTSGKDVAEMVQHLVQFWRRPHSTIGRVRPLPGPNQPRPDKGTSEVWMDPTAEVRDATFIGPVWVGAGRKLDAGRTIVGPAVLWDDPEQRPSFDEIGHIEWLLLEPAAPDESPTVENQPRPGHHAAKRLFDIAFALIALLLTLPLWPIIMLLIWKEDGRPFLFGHTRQSLGGRPFKCWKFRSMFNNAEEMKKKLIAEGKNEADGGQFFMENDPRITKIGKFLRKTNMDELPQFWNVLVGDMSIVGPRPSPDKENQFNPAWREARLSVRPGITGLWQIRRTRQEGTDFQEWIKYDLEYVEKQSLLFDLAIIYRTVTMILSKIVRS